MRIYSRKKGYALSVLMVALLVISLGIAAAIPLLSMKKDTFTNTSVYVKDCIANQSAADLSTTACEGAVTGLTKGFNKDYDSVLYYLSDATYRTAALKVIKESCDDGGSRACNILLDRCAATSDTFQAGTCNIDTKDFYAGGMPDPTDIGYDLNHYITILSSDNTNLGKVYLQTKGAEYYLQRMSYFNDAVKAVCNNNMYTMACEIAAETKTKTYNLNSPQRSDFTESNSATGTQFYDGIVDLVTKNEWTKHYGGIIDDSGLSLVVSGNYIYVAGDEGSDTAGNNDIFVMKLNKSDGTCVWKKHYGGANSDQGATIAVSGDYLYVTGFEASDAAAGSFDIFVMKLNESDGTSVWKKHYGGADADQSYLLAVSGSSIYITGEEWSDTAGNRDAFVMKLNESDGTTVWKKHYGGAAADNAMSLVVSGNYLYVAGYESSDTAGSVDVFVMKLNESDGSSVWKKHYGGADADQGYSLAVSGNYIYVTGLEGSDTAGIYDVFAMKLNESDGSSVWARHYGGASLDYGQSIAVSGNYLYIAGIEMSDTEGSMDAFVMKLNESDGTSVWTKHYGGTEWDQLSSLAVSEGYIYVTGYEQSDTAGISDVLVMRISPTQTSNMDADWTVDGVAMDADWTADGVAMDADWTVDGTAIGALWTASISNQNSAYFTTTDYNQITSIIGGIKSFTISATEPANTKIRGLVSFDDRANWKKFNTGTSTWDQAATSGELAAYYFSTDGNTTAEIETGLTNITTGEVTLDFALYLETDSTGLITPSIDTVTVTYYKER